MHQTKTYNLGNTLILTLRQKLFPVKFIECYVYSIIIYEKDLRFRKKHKKQFLRQFTKGFTSPWRTPPPPLNMNHPQSPHTIMYHAGVWKTRSVTHVCANATGLWSAGSRDVISQHKKKITNKYAQRTYINKIIVCFKVCYQLPSIIQCKSVYRFCFTRVLEMSDRGEMKGFNKDRLITARNNYEYVLF